MRWFWGLMFLLLGVFFLGQNLGVWSGANIGFFLNFWPVILVLLGVAILVRRWKYGWTVILATFLLAAAFFVYAAKNQDKFKMKGVDIYLGEVKEYKISEELPETVTSSTVVVNTGAVDLSLKADSQKLIEGILNSNFSNPELNVVSDGQKAAVDLKTANSNNFRGIGINLKNKLDLHLSKDLPLDLSINSGASSMNLDLSEAKLNNLVIETGASSIDLKLGDKMEGDTSVLLKAGASSFNIKAPKTVGVKITTKTGLSGKSFDGLDKTGDNTYQSKNYNDAEKKIEIVIDAGVSSINYSQY